jgi:hypothetical protein
MRLVAFLLLAFLAGICRAEAQTAYPPLASQAVEGSHVFCLAPCKLYTLSVTSGASSGYVMVFDAATVPADGTVSPGPAYCWNWPASTGQGFTWPFGVQFRNGMTVVYSTGADCLHKTLSATAFFTVQVQ